MPRDPRFDSLFQPVKLGPVTAPNRFYQVPHCSGMGYQRPQTLAAMRAIKAEGGWGVVCTEYCSIDPSSDDGFYPYASLWDDGDIRNQAVMTEAVHKHGALAGVELWHGGGYIGNMLSRQPPMGLQSLPVGQQNDPVQARVMDRADIRDLRRWHVAAAQRAREAGFDIVYVYPCHHYLLHSFLHAETNQRRDEYGGSVGNRVRIVRELLEAVKEAVGDRCAIAMRWSINSGHEAAGAVDPEMLEMAALLNGLPDIWDLTIADYGVEMGTSRFTREGALEPFVAQVRRLIDAPVVTVGRYTSPESMLRLVTSGTADFVGAARPSIADPFLPRKIAEGRPEDIRECIGCNICYAHNSRGVPIRCTQNPTMGEEWRKGWHPERIARRTSEARVLVVGGGPAGLEAARALGERGYRVALAEATRQLGGRITGESTLPGLAEWARVRDWRRHQIEKLGTVEVFLESRMTAADIADFGAEHVAIATGSRWRLDGRSRSRPVPLFAAGQPGLHGVEAIIAGDLPPGPVAVFDEDLYYMASAVAEKLLDAGRRVVFISTSGVVARWTETTNEQPQIQARLIEKGAEIIVSRRVVDFAPGRLRLACIYTGRITEIAVDSLVPVTSREPERRLFDAVAELRAAGGAGHIASLRLIGDAEAPGTIAHAVYSGHLYARELESEVLPARRDRVVIAG